MRTRGLGLEAQGITSGPLWDRASTTLLEHQREDHTRLRRLVSKAFTPRSVGRLDTTITDIITRADRPARRRGTLRGRRGHRPALPGSGHRRVARRSSRGRELFSAWADDFFKLFSWNVVEHEQAILTAWSELDDYIDGMVAERRNSLTDDLISELIRAEDDGDRLTIEELRMLAAGILMAGTDTTRNQLAAAVDILCDHPEQWELLAERPELAMNAVEELMRFYPVIFGAMRMTMEDVEFEGVVIPAGTFVMVNTSAANRDPEVFDEPDRLDITRQGAAPMQTFGAGAHTAWGESGPPRARRSPGGHDAPDGQYAPHRTRNVEALGRNHRPGPAADRIRRSLSIRTASLRRGLRLRSCATYSTS